MRSDRTHLRLDAAPEAYHDWTNHPDWPRQREAARRSGEPYGTGDTVGIQLFRNAVEFIRSV